VELLEGETLRSRLKPGPLPRERPDYAIQIARGLAAAHEKGPHRDPKLRTFVLTDGRVKISTSGWPS
jgi:serine/threonine protein kinase